ncbi:MAG: 3-dehydroquinate synthase [Clostridiales bacterium]|jgi:3-dehydroquinate synthase|nr:3-dehydroquinate synthase [Clostridiales bacterium]
MTIVRVGVGDGYDVVIDRNIDCGGLIKKYTDKTDKNCGENCAAARGNDTEKTDFFKDENNFVKTGKIAIISDDAVFGLYGKAVKASLERAGFRAAAYVFPRGEASKSGGQYLKILEFLAAERLARSDAVLALGGGVTGDMAGFAAATYLRGISYFQMPTTLLAAVDSSVGGKTGINLSAGKNLAGAFYQPKAVLCDTEFLKTLSDDLIADGLGEIVKHAVLDGGELLMELENGGAEICEKTDENREDKRGNYEEKTEVSADEKDMDKTDKNLSEDYAGETARTGRSDAYAFVLNSAEKIIALSVKIKAAIVEKDEKEKNLRKFLNLGHTVGHAVEKLSDYKIHHGKCVAIGLAFIADLSRKRGRLNAASHGRILRLLRKYRLETDCPYEASDMVDLMLSDKKLGGGALSVVMIRDIGDCFIDEVGINGIEAFFSGR